MNMFNYSLRRQHQAAAFSILNALFLYAEEQAANGAILLFCIEKAFQVRIARVFGGITPPLLMDKGGGVTTILVLLKEVTP